MCRLEGDLPNAGYVWQSRGTDVAADDRRAVHANRSTSGRQVLRSSIQSKEQSVAAQ